MFFTLGVESFGEATELEADRRGVSLALLVEKHLDRLRRRFEGLQISCDWDRTIISTNGEHCLRTQVMFLELLERDLIYRRDPPDGSDSASGWALRSSRFTAKCDLDSAPPGWTVEAVASQREALGAVDGIEIRAVIPGVGDIVVFSPHSDAIAQAKFIAVSPNHPEIETLAGPAELARACNHSENGAIPTPLQVAVPGVGELLPLVLTRSVDDRFGPTAAIGIPERDEVDREIAERLRPSAGMSLGAMRVSSKPSPAKRYRLPDLPVAGKAQRGTPVPIVHCRQCGPIPIPSAELPLLRPEPVGATETGDAPASTEPPERECPQCGGPAKQDPASIEWSFDSMWMWPSICSRQGNESAASPGLEGWPPASLVVWGATESEQLLWQRMAGHIANSLSPGQAADQSEPFARVLVHGTLAGDAGKAALGEIDDLDQCIARSGPDVARFAILNAGAVGRSTGIYEHLIRHAERFVEETLKWVEAIEARDGPVPAEIDPSTRSRRRLAAWSKLAGEKVASNLERLEIHKAAYALTLFQQRIATFQSDCLENGELDEADRDAIAVALVRFGRVAEPIVPGLASRIETAAGKTQ